jgi:glycerate dehydrogenase
MPCTGVLTETTAELALALTFAAARRVVEGDKFMRAGQYKGWLPNLFVGKLKLQPTTNPARAIPPQSPCPNVTPSSHDGCPCATGNLLQRKTVGIIGAGRIGTAYACMMMEVRYPHQEKLGVTWSGAVCQTLL